MQRGRRIRLALRSLKKESTMKTIDTVIRVGAAQPFCALHASDTHLTRADRRDDERKRLLAQNRLPVFPTAEEDLRELTALAQAEQLPVLHTGDLSDFVSAANLDAMRAFSEAVDCFMAAGNHEFSLYVGETWEDAAYRAQSLDRVQAVFKNDIRFAGRVMHGVNFIALDNSYYLIEPEQLAALKAEAEKGLPMVLLVHTPLYSPETLALLRENGLQPTEPAYLMAVPEQEMRGYDDHRYRQQLADATTREALEWICAQPLIKAVLTGHLHKDFEADVTPALRQYCTGVGSVRRIRFE